MVTVFDVSQTQGEDIPTLGIGLQGQAPVGVFESLKRLIEEKGYSIRFEDLEPDLFGYVNKEKQIVLKAGASQAQSLDTLAHEAAHALLGHVGSSQDRNQKDNGGNCWELSIYSMNLPRLANFVHPSEPRIRFRLN